MRQKLSGTNDYQQAVEHFMQCDLEYGSRVRDGFKQGQEQHAQHHYDVIACSSDRWHCQRSLPPWRGSGYKKRVSYLLRDTLFIFAKLTLAQ